MQIHFSVTCSGMMAFGNFADRVLVKTRIFHLPIRGGLWSIDGKIEFFAATINCVGDA